MLKIDISNLNALSNEVIVHFDMLCACVEHWVLSQMNIAHVAAVKGNHILDGNAQILQDSLQPNGFTCSHNHAPVFSLYARKCNNWLFLIALGDGFTSKGEEETGG